MKLAPATRPPADVGAIELEWIGSRGECRQQVAWHGELARHAGRTATVVQPNGQRHTISASALRDIERVPGPGRFIYEPDSTVLAAHLEGELAARHQIKQFSPTTGYLTADGRVNDPLLTAFEMLDVLPLDLKRVRAVLRRRGIGDLEIKQRGLTLNLPELRRKLRVKQASNRAVLIIAGQPGRTLAILAERVEP